MIDTKLIDGKSFAEKLCQEISAEVAALRSQGTPGLAVILVGEDPASSVYVRNKGRQTIAAGMNSFEHRLPVSSSEDDLIRLIGQLNRDDSIHGILVQLPLPPQISADKVLATIDPSKDVDGFHVVNAGRLATGLPALVPCTPLGCTMLLKSAIPDMSGMKALVVGRSNIVGKPMAQLLLQQNCTVVMAHSHTKNIEDECRQADILVAAIGRPRTIRGNWIKPGATVIDVGINRVNGGNGKSTLVGDVAFEEALGIAGHITPVPGGVGPMTIACLLQNTITAFKAQYSART